MRRPSAYSADVDTEGEAVPRPYETTDHSSANLMFMGMLLSIGRIEGRSRR